MIVESILRGEPGARRDVVLLNAGAALVVAGVVADLAAGIDRAALTIDAGLGMELLETAPGRAPGRRCRPGGRRGSAGMTIADRDERGPDRLPPPDEDAPDAARLAAAARNVVHEIAERRRDGHPRRDGPAVPGRPPRDRRGHPAAAPDPRPAGRPGPPPHRRDQALVAVGRRDRRPDEDIVARARAYEAGGATAISVLCEPHWFGGSVDDLRAVRAAVSIPVLAKEFVVEAIQLPHLRAAGADLVLLLAVLHDAERLADLVERALEIGLEPLVEAHDEARARAGARDPGPPDRDQQPRPPDARGRHGSGDPAPAARSGRPARRRRVRGPRRGDDRRVAGGRLRRRARRRGARPIGRSGRRRPRVRLRRAPPGRSSEPGRDGVREGLRHHRRRGRPRGGPERRRRDRAEPRPGHPARADAAPRRSPSLASPGR